MVVKERKKDKIEMIELNQWLNQELEMKVSQQIKGTRNETHLKPNWFQYVQI